MNTTTEKTKQKQYHEYAGSAASASLLPAGIVGADVTTHEKDSLEVNLANHIEAFCDCV